MPQSGFWSIHRGWFYPQRVKFKFFQPTTLHCLSCFKGKAVLNQTAISPTLIAEAHLSANFPAWFFNCRSMKEAGSNKLSSNDLKVRLKRIPPPPQIDSINRIQALLRQTLPIIIQIRLEGNERFRFLKRDMSCMEYLLNPTILSGTLNSSVITALERTEKKRKLVQRKIGIFAPLIVEPVNATFQKLSQFWKLCRDYGPLEGRSCSWCSHHSPKKFRKVLEKFRKKNPTSISELFSRQNMLAGGPSGHKNRSGF